MKTFKILINAVIMLMLIFSLSFAVETNYNSTITPTESPGAVTYSFSTTFSDSGSGDIYYTQGFWIKDLTEANGYINAICSEVGTEDVNIFVEYSNTFTGTYVAGTTDTDLDAVGTTAKQDTIGIVAGAAEIKYKAYKYARLKFVAGQAIGSTTISGAVTFWKPEGLKGIILRSRMTLVGNTATS